MRILRVIARLNVGGPAHHVAILTGELAQERYETLLVTGRVGPGEASMDDVLQSYGVRAVVLDELGPEVAPARNHAALRRLRALIGAFRPDIVDTHTAMAGMLGRLAAAARRRPPAIVHTYHGHVLTHYFDPLRTGLFRAIERNLARRTDRLIGVSQATVDELVALRIATRDKFRVVPLGLDLSAFASDGLAASAPEVRAELDIPADAVLFGYIGRLVPIKRVDLLLRAFRRAQSSSDAQMRLIVVGDGPLRARLEHAAAALELDVSFLGFRRDIPRIVAAIDVGVLSSASEGTPVSLIECGAAGKPAITTDVGGVREVVAPGAGLIVPSEDEEAFAFAIARLASDPAARRAMGESARKHVADRYSRRRLLDDVDMLYQELLDSGRACESTS